VTNINSRCSLYFIFSNKSNLNPKIHVLLLTPNFIKEVLYVSVRLQKCRACFHFAGANMELLAYEDEVEIEKDPIDVSQETEIAEQDPLMELELKKFRVICTSADIDNPIRPVTKKCQSKKKSKNYQFTCNICCKRFVSKYSLSKHMEQHEGHTQCPKCGKVSNRRRDMLNHLFSCHYVNALIMEKVRGSFCLVCNQQFDQIKKHMSRFHLDWHTCPECSKKYKSAAQMLNCLYEHVTTPEFEQITCD
jgi:hypothetical protein